MQPRKDYVNDLKKNTKKLCVLCAQTLRLCVVVFTLAAHVNLTPWKKKLLQIV
jgi:hypothetical protein